MTANERFSRLFGIISELRTVVAHDESKERFAHAERQLFDLLLSVMREAERERDSNRIDLLVKDTQAWLAKRK
jgi:hypothetical protein